MIRLIGKNGCSRCEMVKNILSNKGINFDYKKLEDLSQEEKNKYLKLARMKKQMEMPLIIKNEKIVDIKEVM